jgi:hypothetical protein
VGNPKNKTNKIEIKHITITQPGKLRLDQRENEDWIQLKKIHKGN